MNNSINPENAPSEENTEGASELTSNEQSSAHQVYVPKKTKITTLFLIPYLSANLIGSKTIEQVSEETGKSVSEVESLQRQHNGMLMAYVAKLHIEAQGVLNTIELGLEDVDDLNTYVKIAKKGLDSLVDNLGSFANPR